MTHSKKVSARGLLILFVVALCVAADRLSKAWALANLTHGQPQPFIPGFIKFTLTTNPGAAFSIGSQNGQIMGVVATVLSLVILGWIVKRVLSNEPLPAVEQIGMGCLLGGAIGNLIDRYTRGQVTDFLEFAFVTFPVFNVADALIDVGIGCLFIAMYMLKHDESKEHKSNDNSSRNESSKTQQDTKEAEDNSMQNGTNSASTNEVLSVETAEANVDNKKSKHNNDSATSNISSSTGGTTTQTTQHLD